MCYKNEVLWNSLWHLKAFALSWSFSEISFLYLSKNFNIDENNKDHNLKWPYISDHPYRMFKIGGSESGKTNALLNLMKEQDSDSRIDKIYLYAKDLSEPKY